MEPVLNEIEVRVLGCLIEKELTTPEYYPLTLNALVNACNQKTNRSPVVSYEETTVVRGLDGLREKGLAAQVYSPGSRVAKFRHSVPDRFDLDLRETAVLCELLLRGPQTAGELRAHAERMYGFRDPEEVEESLRTLTGLESPLAVRLPRQPGKKEERYIHLLSGRNEISNGEPAISAGQAISPENERISRLEQEVTELKKKLEDLRHAFDIFRSQF